MSWNPQTQHLSGTNKHMADKYYNNIKKQNEKSDTSKQKNEDTISTEELNNNYEEYFKLANKFSEKYPDYIKKVRNNEDYKELEKELNDLIKASNELLNIYVKNDK